MAGACEYFVLDRRNASGRGPPPAVALRMCVHVSVHSGKRVVQPLLVDSVVSGLELALDLQHDRVLLTSEVVGCPVRLDELDVKLDYVGSDRVETSVTFPQVCEVQSAVSSWFDVGQNDLCEAPVKDRTAALVRADPYDVQSNPVRLDRCRGLVQSQLNQLDRHHIPEVQGPALYHVLGRGGPLGRVPIARVQDDVVVQVLLVSCEWSGTHHDVVVVIAEDVTARCERVEALLIGSHGLSPGHLHTTIAHFIWAEMSAHHRSEKMTSLSTTPHTVMWRGCADRRFLLVPGPQAKTFEGLT